MLSGCRRERTWLGAYGQVEWKPTSRFGLTVGLRLNHTQEELEGVPGMPQKTARSIYAQLHKAGRA